jgi:hypothetical protein
VNSEEAKVALIKSIVALETKGDEFKALILNPWEISISRETLTAENIVLLGRFRFVLHGLGWSQVTEGGDEMTKSFTFTNPNEINQ